MPTALHSIKTKALVSCSLLLLTMILYLPTVGHEFIQYDDQQYVTENPMVQAGLTWRGLWWAFGFHAGNWHPLAWLSHMLDCTLFGAWAGGHHLSSAFIHALTCVGLFLTLNRMTGALWKSAVVAAIFAWHPLRVESVAWVAERKDVLCGFFWVMTMWAHSRYSAAPSTRGRFAVLAFYALALMSKPMAVTLPLVLLLLDYWPLNRVPTAKSQLSRWYELVREKLPLFAMAALTAGLTLAAQENAMVSKAGLGSGERLIHALAAYGHYLEGLFWPGPMAVFYPYEKDLPTITLLFSVVMILVISALALLWRKQRPYLIVGWLWFLGTLVPVIGLVQVGDQAWADRYTYLPHVGLAMATVWLVAIWLRAPVFQRILGLAFCASMWLLAAKQISHWQNTRSVFEQANRVTVNNYLAETVLGSVLAQEGKWDAAMQRYQRALAIKPGYPQAHFYLGNALEQQGRLDEAIENYRLALWFRPMEAQIRIFLGMALAKNQRPEEAIIEYQTALKLDPQAAAAENNLARIYHSLGQLAEAEQHYGRALAINPALALAHNNLGVLQLQRGQVDAGVTHLRAALKINPTNSETMFNLACGLGQQAQWPEALGLFQQLAPVKAADARFNYEFGKVLDGAGRTKEAMSRLAQSVLLQPDYAEALDRLAWVLATDRDPGFRNGVEASKMANRACELSQHQNPAFLITLAATLAEQGNFAGAIQTLQSAARLANDPSLREQLTKLQSAFSQGQPWRR